MLPILQFRALRLVDRTLVYKGVCKEWHANTIVVTQLSTDAIDDTNIGIAVSDFTSATLRLGQDLYVPGVRDIFKADVDQVVNAEVAKAIEARKTETTKADRAKITEAIRERFSGFEDAVVAEWYDARKGGPLEALEEHGFVPTRELCSEWCWPELDDHEQW